MVAWAFVHASMQDAFCHISLMLGLSAQMLHHHSAEIIGSSYNFAGKRHKRKEWPGSTPATLIDTTTDATAMTITTIATATASKEGFSQAYCEEPVANYLCLASFLR